MTIQEALDRFEAEQFLKYPLLSQRDIRALRMGFVYGAEWAIRNELEKMSEYTHKGVTV